MSAGNVGDTVPRVFSVPVGRPFIACFIESFLSGRLFDRGPLSADELADACIFVPTRRAGDALLAGLATATGGRARFLPRTIALGDDEAFADVLGADLLPAARDAERPAIGEFDRRMFLFSLVETWRTATASQRPDAGGGEPFHVGESCADAFALAGDLARLIDETIIEDVPLARLAEAMPDSYDPARHDTYWTITQQFLQIATRHWPEVLDEIGMCDAADRLKQHVRALATHVSIAGSKGPVVVAGSTGSVTATAELMAAIARLPMGAVVLPGLDTTLDDAAWSLIGAERASLTTRYAHAQTQLKRTLGQIGIAREAVRRLAAPTGRERLVSEIMRPAEATADWRATRPLFAADPATADTWAGIGLIEASDEIEEALAIALAMRETLETPGKTAALVTADPVLGRRVAVELGRWSIAIEDSAGRPLAMSPPAVLARLALAAADPQARAVDLAALLRHPLCRLGVAEPSRSDLVTAIEIAGLRGPQQRGVADLVRRLDDKAAAPLADRRRDPAPLARLDGERLAAAAGHARRLATALAGLRADDGTALPLRTLALAHRAALDALLEGAEDGAGPGGWPDDPAGRMLASLFDRIALAAQPGPLITLADYSGIFETLTQEALVRPEGGGHPRLSIRGLLEARLLDTDRVILGGLNDGVWPPETAADPFLNRAMRMALGLQPPERRTGQTAHDFAMLLGAGEVLLTRARKVEGQPMVASRFLRRLLAFTGKDGEEAMRSRGQPYCDWALAIDRPDRTVACACPSPRIIPALMPSRLSLTEIETLYRDPYILFARHVLGLDVLPPLDAEIDGRDRGTAVHQALADYVRLTSDAEPEDGARLLRALARQAFAAIERSAPETAAFWWCRFDAVVPWLVTQDRTERVAGERLFIEESGRLGLDLAGGHRLVLSTRSDRIALRPDGSLAIIDYKTGSAPSRKTVASGLAPQLPLTAALAAAGAFPALGRHSLDGLKLAYLQVIDKEGCGKVVRITPEKDATWTAAGLAREQMAQLVGHLNQYLTGQRGFTARRIPEKTGYVSDYDGLSRHREWAFGGDDDAEDEE